jgi:YbbR domain-containing protein
MNLIFDNWQLKLLSLVLALGLFAVVAFQENPPTTTTVNAPIYYNGLPPTKILVNSPSAVKVTVTGLADALRITGSSNVSVQVDASKLKNGTQSVTGHPHVLTANVRSVDDSIPINVTVDDRVTVPVPVEARINYAEGWEPVPNKIVVTPANLNITGAASELKDLKAFVAPQTPIAATVADIPSLPIQLERSGHVVSVPNDTSPATSVDSSLNASLHVEAQRPNQTRRVPVVETPTGTPAPGYRITAITLDPLFIDIAGPVGDLASIDSVNLPAIAVDGATQSFVRSVKISLPANITSSSSAIQVTITIQKNPAVQPSPSPTT